jgi:hypothetical protein
MKRFVVLAIFALLLSPLSFNHADARGGFGGGGFHGGGFAGGGFRGGGFAGGGFRGAAIGGGYRGGFVGGGYRQGFVGGGARWAGAGVGRPGWNGGWRPGWGGAGWGYRRVGAWPWYGAAVGLGLAGAAYYNSYAPYGYYDECPTVRQQYWDGYGYRIVWVNACSGY